MRESQRVRFGSFCMDVGNERLYRGAEVITLPPKVFTLLRTLVARPGQLITKAELFQMVWPDTVVGDAVLSVAMAELRKALGDDPRTPQFIETVHRRGYRFIYPLEDLPGQPVSLLEAGPRQRSDEEQEVVRKLAAILSADVHGYSRLMGQDEVGTIRTLTTYRAVITGLIKQHGGRVVDAVGDNVLAEFPSAVAAVQCAVEIQRALKAKNMALPDARQMAFRIGINVGDVVVEGERLYGEGVNIAARLEGLAEGGGVCVSGTVYDQVKAKAALRYEYLGEQRVKNIAEPVRVYRVQWEAASASAGPGASRHEPGGKGEDPQPQAKGRVLSPASSPQSPAPFLVGRERELTQLHGWFEKALSGERQLLFVTGEPGIGKTTVVNAFVAECATRGSLWLGQGQCIEHFGVGEPYLPVLGALEHLCQAPASERVRAVVRQHAPIWLLQLPGLLSPVDQEDLQRRTAGATRERMLREMAGALEALATEQPLILVLEDLHWSDAATLDLLAYLARRPQPARLLVIGTYRPVDAIVRDHPLRAVQQELQLHGQCTELPIGFLGEEDVMAYLNVRFPGHRLPATLGRALYERTEGNPLFITAVVNDWLSQGMFIQREGAWVLQRAVQEITGQIPESVRHLVMRQYDRLSPAEQHVLEAASVAGMNFSAAAVAAGVGEDLVAVEARCEQFARWRQLIEPHEVATWPDGTTAGRYRFLHALYQEVLYTRVPAGRRGQLHQRIGERLEAAYGERSGEIASELALHFEQGRDYRKAVQYLSQAGQHALQRSAHQEAIIHLTKGLELLKALPDTAERTQQELNLQITLGASLMAIKGWGAQEVEHTYARARALCREIEATASLFPALGGLCAFYQERAQFQTALELAEELLRIAQSERNPDLLLWAHLARGGILFFLGDLSVAQNHLEESLALYDPQPRRSYGFVQDPGVTAFSCLAHVLYTLGYPDRALERSQEALSLARKLVHPISLGVALSFAAAVHRKRGERKFALELEKELAAVSNEHGFPYWLAEKTFLEGWDLVEQGHKEEGIASMCEGLAAHRTIGSEQGRPELLAQLAKAYEKAGQVEKGLSVLDEAMAVVHKTEERTAEAELYRLKGELRLQRKRQRATGTEHQVRKSDPHSLLPGAQGEAEVCFLKAIKVAQRQQAKSLELRATVSLARLWQQQGKEKEAHKLLAEIYHWFTEGFDTKDLQEAKTLLDALEGPEVKTQAKSDPALAFPGKPSLAVLPFVNMSGDPEQEYFSDGITEDLITDLSRFSGLFVIARNSTFTYKGKAVKVQEVSRELGVQYVLEGSVRKATGRVRITAQLVDATTGHHLWAERYDRELQDIFALQDEITEQIVSNLSAEVWQAERERVRRIPTENLTAYDCLLRGAEYYFRLTPGAMLQARQMFEKATEQDPQYAEAYVWLGWTYDMEWIWQWSLDPQTLERWFALAQKALALDGSLPGAHRLLGEAYLERQQVAQAIAEAEHALILNPSDAYSYMLLAITRSIAGQPDEGIGLAEKAMRLDPRNREWYLYAVGLAYALAGQYEEAVVAFTQVVARYPTHVGAYLLLTALYSVLGRRVEAQAAAAVVLQLSPHFSVEVMRQRIAVQDPAVAEGFLAALRQAGLK